VVFYVKLTTCQRFSLQEGFKFFFYANEPKHIHVMKGGEFAKIELSTPSCCQKRYETSRTQKSLGDHQRT
jgi:hypothetical protein